MYERGGLLWGPMLISARNVKKHGLDKAETWKSVI